MRLIFAVNALALLGAWVVSPAVAQPAPGNTSASSLSEAQAAATLASMQRIGGEITATDGSSLSIRGADGNIVQVALEPHANIITSHPSSVSEIRPGDFVAAANTNIDDHTGRANGLNVFPPGVRRGEGSYAMQQPNTTMTNATVAEVVDVADGRDLLVRYPGGERHIIVAPNARVSRQSAVEVAQLTPGVRVTAMSRIVDGSLSTGYVIVDAASLPAH